MKGGGGGGGGEVSSCVDVCGGALLGGVNNVAFTIDVNGPLRLLVRWKNNPCEGARDGGRGGGGDV